MIPRSPRPLTAREHQVLALLAEGKGYKQVACILDIAHRTVKEHIQNAKGKAGLSGPVHRLVLWYIAHGADDVSEEQQKAA